MRAVVVIFAALAVAAFVRADGPPRAEASYNKAYVPKPSDYYEKPSYDPSYNKPSYKYPPGYNKPYYGYKPSYDKPSYGYKPSYDKPSYGYKPNYDKPSYDDESDYTQYGDKEPQVIRLAAKVVGKDLGEKDDELGSTGVIVRSLLLDGEKVGMLWQSGIAVSKTALDGEGLYNYQGTISLDKTSEFPKGKIFFVGDGSGFGSDTPTYLPKSIVGGTGLYALARGTIERIPPGGPGTAQPIAGDYYLTLYY